MTKFKDALDALVGCENLLKIESFDAKEIKKQYDELFSPDDSWDMLENRVLEKMKKEDPLNYKLIYGDG